MDSRLMNAMLAKDNLFLAVVLPYVLSGVFANDFTTRSEFLFDWVVTIPFYFVGGAIGYYFVKWVRGEQ